MKPLADDEKKLITEYLFEVGKRHILGAGIHKVDTVAELFYDVIYELDQETANKLYNYYAKKA